MTSKVKSEGQYNVHLTGTLASASVHEGIIKLTLSPNFIVTSVVNPIRATDQSQLGFTTLSNSKIYLELNETISGEQDFNLTVVKKSSIKHQT